jgi:AcrR family transcriptional regulator
VHKPRMVADKGRRKMEKIGKAAAQVFDKIGYLQANLDDVAAAVRMSKGGLYHYFASKEEILYFVLDRYMDRVLENLEDSLRALPPESSKLEFIIQRHIRLYAAHKAESKTLLHDFNCLKKKNRQSIAEKERRYLAVVEKALAEYLGDNKRIDAPEVTTLAFLLFGMCNWCYQWYNPNGPIDSETLSRIIWMVLNRGISAYPAGGITRISHDNR